jgi:polyhydroxyalkanoate synthesis regulator phasin
MVRREDMRAMQDAWRAYLDLALGLTETSRKKATKVARKLVGRGNATAEQLQSMAEDLVSTSMANREALSRLVRFELERALGKIGLATADEVSALNARVKELEQQLEEARTGGAATPAPASARLLPVPTDGAQVEAAPVRKVAKKAVARKTVAKKATVPVVAEVAEPVPATSAPASPARKAPAKRVATAAPIPAKKTAAKKTTANKAVAKKTTKAVATRTPAPAGEPA